MLDVVRHCVRQTQALCWPPPELHPLPSLRTTAVPDTFASVAAYRRTFTEALFEELNLQLFAVNAEYYAHYGAITQGSGALRQSQATPRCPHGQCRVQVPVVLWVVDQGCA